MDKQIELASASKEDLPAIHAIEQATDTAEYISGYSLEEHTHAFATPGITYLKICTDGQIVGFFILVADDKYESIEFRRIAIKTNARGIGQQTILMMEAHCRRNMNCRRIWLDVLAHNQRAKHIYEKLGYSRFNSDAAGENGLHFYEKHFND